MYSAWKIYRYMKARHGNFMHWNVVCMLILGLSDLELSFFSVICYANVAWLNVYFSVNCFQINYWKTRTLELSNIFRFISCTLKNFKSTWKCLSHEQRTLKATGTYACGRVCYCSVSKFEMKGMELLFLILKLRSRRMVYQSYVVTNCL